MDDEATAIAYTFTMSEEDQSKFIGMPRDMKFNEMISILKSSRPATQDNNNKKNFGTPQGSRFVLSFLDQKKMQATIMRFPLDLKLFDRTVYEFSDKNDELHPEEIYDLRFVMLLIYHSVSPTLMVDCSNFVLRRALSLTLAGLSSYCDNMRKLCYKILERFYGQLESSLGFDKKLYTNLIDLLRNSIHSANEQLKPLFSLYLVRMIDVFAHPFDPLYETVKEYISGRPRLDPNTVELFDDLVYLSDIDKYQYAMRWLLSILRDGIRTPADIKTAKNLELLPYIMNLYNSQLRFERANEVICSILIRFTKIDRGVNMLVTGYAFLPWLDRIMHTHIETGSKGPKSESLKDITISLSSLCFNLIDNIDSRPENLCPNVYIELSDVFLTLYELIITADRAEILEHHIEYSGKILKMLHKNSDIGPSIKSRIYKTFESKLAYLEPVQ